MPSRASSADAAGSGLIGEVTSPTATVVNNTVATVVNNTVAPVVNESMNYSDMGVIMKAFDPLAYEHPNMPSYILFDATDPAKWTPALPDTQE